MKPENTSIRSYEVQSVTQALDLIDALITAREGMTLSQLSSSVGLSKNKIFRILSTLEHRGMIEKDRRCLYRLGITAFGTAHRILSSESLLNHARPIMVELAATLNEAVYLATMVRGEAMLQEMIDCHQPIKTESFVGSSFPFPDAVVGSCGSKQFDVAGIRVYVSELNEEITTVSASLMDSSDKIAGAIVVMAPTFRMPIERIMSEMIIPVSEAALQLSRKLGNMTGSGSPNTHSTADLELSGQTSGYSRNETGNGQSTNLAVQEPRHRLCTAESDCGNPGNPAVP